MRQKFCGAFLKATASPSRARRRIGVSFPELFFAPSKSKKSGVTV
jgi:hypothetical protein